MRALKMICAASLAVIPPAHAQSTEGNNGNQSPVYHTCEEYYRYIDGEIASPSSECGRAENFLIENSELNVTRFMESYLEESGPNSALAYLIQGWQSFVFGQPLMAYHFLDEADRSIFSGFNSNGDSGRAAFYATVLSDLKYGIVFDICEDHGRCAIEIQNTGVGDIFGSEFSFVDAVRADTLLYCILRSDGFGAPIQEVLLSQYFRICVGGENND